jgi:[ribosomal protein S5]-alanine N-acetyltransferase
MTDALGPRPIPAVDLQAATVADLQLLATDRAAFAQRMGSPAPGGWPEFPEAIGFTIERLAMHPNEANWWMHYFLLNGLIVGSGGYVGRPKKGVVEIGYEIAPGFRGRHLGTGAASALTEQAFDSGEVESVIAHTLDFENPSTKVLARLGYIAEEQLRDASGTRLWRWRLSRD